MFIFVNVYYDQFCVNDVGIFIFVNVDESHEPHACLSPLWVCGTLVGVSLFSIMCSDLVIISEIS